MFLEYTGAWAGSVEYDGARDIAWVLAEVLRMYARENPPLLSNRGLALKPRLVQQRPPDGATSDSQVGVSL